MKYNEVLPGIKVADRSRTELDHDHIYHEMMFFENFNQDNGRYPEDFEVPDRFTSCRCRWCDPNPPPLTIDHISNDALRDARLVPITTIVLSLGLGPLQRRGGEASMICPFHDDTKPSLRINTDKNLWYCDPCGEGGDAIDFYMGVTDEKFSDAVREMATMI